MTQTTLEYVLNSIYIAIVSGLDTHQRALANDTIQQCAGLPCAPRSAPEILRRIANNAVEVPPPSRPKLKLVSGG
jgi:hypothetical protein